MELLFPLLFNSLAGALVVKILLLCIKRNGSFLGLFLSWFLASLAGLYIPYPFISSLIFGLLFVKVTNIAKIWPLVIPAVFLFWILEHRLGGAMSGISRPSQQILELLWRQLTNSLNVLYSGRVST